VKTAVCFSLVMLTSGPARAESRYVARTPDATLALALARAAGPEEDGALAALALATALNDDASPGAARKGLLGLGRGTGTIAEQARWAAAELDPDPGARPAGLVRNLAVVGPFADHGGGLNRREGPEGHWSERSKTFDWGAYEVRWRGVPERAISARGAPLDLMIYPRRESCTYLATRVRLPAAQTFELALASTGSVRWSWDEQELGRSDDLHVGAMFDRLAARIEAAPGDHLLSVKVCSGPTLDQGRVRLRAQRPDGAPLDLPTSATWEALPPAAAQVTALPTALGRALEPGPRSSSDRALAAGLIRQVAGADDLRSPRASGLLDAVASAADVTADHLAMAGWVAPFGAQRSGWLGLALERALAAGDLEVASFAERRLTANRIRAGSADWALATAARPPLASDGDPEAKMIRALARAAVGVESIRREVSSELQALARSAPASATLWEHLAGLTRDLDPGSEVQARDQLALRLPERRDQAWASARTSQGQAAVARAVEAALPDAPSAEAQLALGALLERAGLRPRAAQVYASASALSPNHDGLHAALAVARYGQGDKAGGDRALARARALAPSNARYRAEASLRSSRPDAPDVAPGLLVDPAVFLARKLRDPARKGEVSYRTLHELRALTMQQDRRASYLIHVAREVVIAPRTQAELQDSMDLPGTPEVLRARVHRVSGAVEAPLEQKVQRGRATFRWRELETGDVVELAARSWTDTRIGERGEQPFTVIWPAGSWLTVPTLYSEVILESPAEAPLAFDILHGQPDRRSEEVRNGHRVVRLTWEHPRNLPEEPLGPPPAEVLPTVVVSLYPGWDEFLRWFRDATAGFTDPDEQIKRLAAELTAGEKTRDGKVRALFQYVADKIRYVNYASSERWLPNRPQQVLARRQGDCDDKATLLITLLKACGIEGQLALVQRTELGMPSLLSAKNAAVPYFNHAITFLPGDKHDPPRWLDATDTQARVDHLHVAESGVPAVLVTPDGPGAVVTTPISAPEDHGADERWTIQLGAGGAGELEAEDRFHGDSAFFMRQSLSEAAARANVIERTLSYYFSSIDVDPKITFDGNAAGGEARVAYHGRSSAIARKEGADLVFPLAPVQTLTSRLAPLVTRTLAVRLPTGEAPTRDVHEVRVTAPPGYRIASLPRSGREPGGPFGEASVECRRQGSRTIIVKDTVTFRAATVPPDQYTSWRRWLQRVDGLRHQSVRFVPVKAAP
jgi:Flp pilus assembly protein TadD